MSAKRNLDTLNVRLLNFTDETIYHRGRPVYLLYPDTSGCIAGPIGINICPGDIIIDGSGTTHNHSSYTQAMTGDLNVNSRIQLAVDPANLSGGSGMPPGHDGVVGGGDAQPGQIIFTRDVSGNYTFFGYEQTDGGTWGWHAFSTSTSKLSNIWTSEGNGTIYFNGSPDPTNVGIGNNNPLNTLDVNGSVAIGNTYAGTITAPTDGVIIKGNVGIGTHNPTVKLDVSGSGHFTDNLTVTGNTILNTLSAGDSTLTNVGITNNASIGGTLNVIGATELGGTLDVTGNTTLSTLWVNETLNVIGATELGGTLDVTGNTTLELVTIKGSLDITGTVNLNNTTQSTSSTTGALTIDGGVGIAKNTNIGGILGVMGATELGGTMDVSGATTISDTLNVTGTSTLASATVGGTLGVTGATILSDTLNVTGTSTLASATVGGTLGVTGATILSDTLNVTGTSTLASATVGGTLGVTGATILSDTLNVTGDTNLASVTITGTLTDHSDSSGISGEMLTSTGVGIKWIPQPTPITDHLLVGSVMMWPRSTVDEPWFICDGSGVADLSNNYPQLYTFLHGNTLPDYRGAFPGMPDGGYIEGPVAPNTDISGDTTIPISALPSHTHVATVNDPSHNHIITDPGHKHEYTYIKIIPPILPPGTLSLEKGAASENANNPTTSEPTGITVNDAQTGITVDNASTGDGGSFVPRYFPINFIIYAGPNFIVNPTT